MLYNAIEQFIHWRLHHRNRQARRRGPIIVSKIGGIVHGGTTPLTTLYIGRHELAHNVQLIFYGDDCMVLDQQNLIENTRKTVERGFMEKPDIIVVDAPIEELPIPSATDAFAKPVALPPLVNAEIDIRHITEVATYLQKYVSKDHRRALKRADDLQLIIREVNFAQHIENFYHSMLIPSAQLRHGKKAHIPSLQGIQELNASYKLFLLAQHNRDIAGYLLLCSAKRKRAEIWRVGILPDVYDNDKLLKAINVSLDAHALKMALQRRYRTLSLGPTNPVLSDGLFGYKKRWGCTYVVGEHTTLSVYLGTAAQHVVLKQRPLLLNAGSQVYGRMALSQNCNNPISEIQQLLDQAYFPNLQKLEVLSAPKAHFERRSLINGCPVEFIDT